jgi:feruloyl esterase
MRETIGAELADGFTRVFMIPGMYHCSGGSGPSDMDVVTAIMKWVENDEAPDSLITTQSDAGQIVASRPVFNYPLISKWDGSGDPALAESYQPAEPEVEADESYEWIGKELFTGDGEVWCVQDGVSVSCDAR